MNRILITGGSGFVGSWLCNDLVVKLAGAAEIHGTTRGITALPTQEVIWHKLDLVDTEGVEDLVAKLKPDVIVHLAAQTSVQESRKDPRQTWAVNLGGTMNLTTSVMRHSPDCRFIYVGSSEIYGGSFRRSQAPLTEDGRLDPESEYAASKSAADLLVGQMAKQGLKAVRLRPFSHTGPGQDGRFVVPAFAAQIVNIELGNAEPVIKVGNLEAYRDFLDVRDIVSAYRSVITRSADFEPGQIINLASGTPRKIGTILEQLLGLSKVHIRVEVDPDRLRPNDTPFAVGDASLARKVLDWAPEVNFEHTLHDILEHLRMKLAKKN